MPEVFINYRTGDGDKTAAAIERELSHRFGSEQIFRAGKSIGPGELFDDTLLQNVRRSSVLLAVIGPRWLDAPDASDRGRRALDNRDDWVRREILEAISCGVQVVPVLDGRTMARLDRTALPAALARLADRQFLRLDIQRGSVDFEHLGNELARLVPRLAELDRTRAAGPPPAPPGGSANTTGDVSGPVVQANGDLRGQVAGTVINSPTGPVHAGQGDLNPRSVRFEGAVGNYVEHVENAGDSSFSPDIGHRPRRRTDDEDDA
ncbi:TIR domain-containing protein [Streptomyces boncukensis]|uniref:TIR domain-containing protein n=1 Tax=Streptomyces boncukensis TaxID=2711219 RepID=A0A6G4X0G2_9ACTN|nr:TIR domain-containing protein [Streptomyces boncukensis]NGO71039.1 TIR domain-containing protein [Streptomyces boncukensis]